MSRAKKQKIDVKLDNREEKKVNAPSRKSKLDRIINFDAYFQKLMRKDSKILIHHKAPMRKYAEENGLDTATEKEFDSVFAKY